MSRLFLNLRCGRTVLVLAVLAGAWHETPGQANAQSASLDLVDRLWWSDLGSSGGSPWGMLYMFKNEPPTNGWRTGTLVTFMGPYGNMQRGFSWKFTESGELIIDHASRIEKLRFTGVWAEEEVVFHTLYPYYWTSTRSEFTPEYIRRYFYY